MIVFLDAAARLLFVGAYTFAATAAEFTADGTANILNMNPCYLLWGLTAPYPVGTPAILFDREQK